MSTTAEDLAVVTDFIAQVAAEDPARVMMAVVAALVDGATGTNPDLKDYMRLRLYREIARRIL